MVSAGRVKTLHPNVHGGILGKRKDGGHQKALQALGIGFIDIVVVNLYPFRQTVTASQPPSFPDAVEQIDIGRCCTSSPWLMLKQYVLVKLFGKASAALSEAVTQIVMGRITKQLMEC